MLSAGCDDARVLRGRADGRREPDVFDDDVAESFSAATVADVDAADVEVTAFDADDASEQLVIVAERGPGKKSDPQEIADTVRAAIASRHGVMARDILMVPAGSIPRTSSGKIARRATKAAYIDGSLRGGYKQTAFPDSV